MVFFFLIIRRPPKFTLFPYNTLFQTQQQTKLKVIDNSGAKLVRCIKVLGGFKKKKASTNDLIIVSVIKLRNKFKITSKEKKGETYKAMEIRTKTKKKTKQGRS